MSERASNNDMDVLIVGAGFSGIYHLYLLRKLGYSARIFEAAPEMGGTWWSNCYPGARVDSEYPHYQFSLPELWKDWTWKERFPGRNELQEYFQYMDRKLDVKKDISFNTKVTAAHFNEEEHRWVVTTEERLVVRPRFLILCVGFASKPYTPKFKGLEKFEGICYHTSHWPQEGVDLKNKRVGVIGTGASGVQVIQEIGPEVSHLTVFQRTPNMALPMQQKKMDEKQQLQHKALYPTIFRRMRQTTTGFDHDIVPKSLFSASPEERVLLWEDHWVRGGFRFLIANFNDTAINEDANREAYNFWRAKVRARLNDPKLHEILAPTIPPHPLGAKRPSLEQTYYEVFNQPNVTLVDLNQCGMTEVTRKGLLTEDGVEHEFDVLVLATGFDSLTGGITQIDIRGVDGVSIAEKWADGVYTNLGMTSVNFPNMFFPYNVQSPTPFSNAPALIEIQGKWIVQCIKHMQENGLTAIYATPEAEIDWRNMIMDTGYQTLHAKGVKANSWYFGANIPGKKVEPLNYVYGVHKYNETITGIAAKGYEGFQLLKPGETVN